MVDFTQAEIRSFYISYDVEFTEHASLADIRRDADRCDLIVVDRFNKLDVDSREFEKLRSNIPRTVFVIIFQKTTTGGLRGGSSIIFNSAATIDVVLEIEGRTANMIKGRYGTQGWKYNITKGVASEEE